MEPTDSIGWPDAEVRVTLFRIVSKSIAVEQAPESGVAVIVLTLLPLMTSTWMDGTDCDTDEIADECCMLPIRVSMTDIRVS